MIAAILLAATTAAAPKPPPPSLEGVKLGDDLKTVAAAHQAHFTWTSIGEAYTWRRADGGVVMISGDAGKVQVVDFTPSQDETDVVSLPVVGDFGAHSNGHDFGNAIGTGPVDTCAASYNMGVCAGYPISGGSEIVVQFEGPGDGWLRRATWGSHDTLVKLRMLPASTSPMP